MNNPQKPPEDRLVPPLPLNSPAHITLNIQQMQPNQHNLLNQQISQMPHISQQMGQIGQQLPQQLSLVRSKKQSEDYDSSATETADEENESSPANRQSPKVGPYAGNKILNASTTISVVPPQLQNGPPSNVRDVMLNVIERQLKNSQQPPPLNKPIQPIPLMKPIDARGNSSADITFVREYRNEPQKPPMVQRGQDGLATLSIVNSQPQQHMMSQHHLGISSQIAATITPVPPPNQQVMISLISIILIKLTFN